ncbi:MAG: hypothetical protein OXM01_10810 [Gemmatimonadota bacterium]|nr:hypothetical protein [Gemmatimonadota bacterium]
MEPEKSHTGDQLSQLLSAYDPAMPEDLAAKTLARLLQNEPDRERRRALLKAFAGRVEELQNGLGCSIAVVSIGDCSVVVPTSALARDSQLIPSISASKKIKSIVRKVDEREVPVGVGYTFTIDAV